MSVSTATFHTVAEALEDLKSGRQIIVVDDENRENEGDLVCAAQFATPAAINFMATEARGLICLAMQGSRLDELEIPLMVGHNTDSNQTAFTVSIDGSPQFGVTTGISASDRSRTIQAAIHPATRPDDLRRPGHIFPLRARDGGVLKRAGHTEAAVDLALLAGLYPAGVICEIQNADGSMARLPDLWEYARQFDLKIITIASLIEYRLQNEHLVHREGSTSFQSEFGSFQLVAYRDALDQLEHVALIKGDPHHFSEQPVLVRVHTEDFLSDTLGALQSDSRRQLETALKMIDHQGQGVVVYLSRQRGSHIVEHVKTYTLQDMGLTRTRHGLESELRNYGIGAQILRDLGIRQMRLLTNTTRKISGLKGFGLEVIERVPLLLEENDHNIQYLNSHPPTPPHALQTYLLTLAVYPAELPSSSSSTDPVIQRALWQENLRRLTSAEELVAQRDQRPKAAVLFGAEAVVMQVGLESSGTRSLHWYKPERGTQTYRQEILNLLLRVVNLPNVGALAWLVASGGDPIEALREDFKTVTYTQPDLQSWGTQSDPVALGWQENTNYRLSLL